MSERYTNPTPQYLDQNGDPVPGGLLNFFDTGTSTRKNTFSDAALTTANSNPVVLDSTGRAPDIFYSGTAKVTLETAEEVQIWERDPVGGTFAQQANDWVSSTVYSQNDIVQGSDTLYYISRTDLNQGNDPITATANWSKLEWQTALTNAEMLTHDLTGVDRVITTGDAADNDGGGHEWISTGGTGAAGTTDYPNRVLFDLEGNEFQETFNRYVWHDQLMVGASDMTITTGTGVKSATATGGYPAIFLNDATDGNAAYGFPPQYQWNTGTIPAIKLLFTTSGANTSDSVRINLSGEARSNGEAISSTSALESFDVAVNDTQAIQQEVTLTLASPMVYTRTSDSIADSFWIQIEREPGHGNDTVTGDFLLLGFNVLYTSDGPTAGDP